MKHKSLTKFLSETCRRESFIDWNCYPNPDVLACDGFYSLRFFDWCACIFCGVRIGHWETTDQSVTDRHLQKSPHCPFLRNQPVGNIPSTCDRYFRLYKAFENSSRSNKFKKYQTCLDSFATWTYHHIAPEKLARAGFYYSKQSDYVKCFYCGNGLHNWKKGDDPLTEHARYYPHCFFVQIKLEEEDREAIERWPGEEEETITDDNIEELMMNLDIMKTVVARGYDKTRIKKVLKMKIEKDKIPFRTLDCCIRAISRYSILNKKGDCLWSDIENDLGHRLYTDVEWKEEEEEEEIEVGNLYEICMDRKIDTNIKPCAHELCSTCALNLETDSCPFCRNKIGSFSKKNNSVVGISSSSSSQY